MKVGASGTVSPNLLPPASCRLPVAGCRLPAHSFRIGESPAFPALRPPSAAAHFVFVCPAFTLSSSPAEYRQRESRREEDKGSEQKDFERFD